MSHALVEKSSLKHTIRMIPMEMSLVRKLLPIILKNS